MDAGPTVKNPTALSDGAAFFASVRKGLFGALTNRQVEGSSACFRRSERRAGRLPGRPMDWRPRGTRQRRRMQPVREAFWLTENWRKTNLRYYPWYGRGFVQLTWEANYKRADEALGLNGALIANPDMALKPDIAAKSSSRGMERAGSPEEAERLSAALGRAGFDAYKEARGSSTARTRPKRSPRKRRLSRRRCSRGMA
jgi:hypothetical protein